MIKNKLLNFLGLAKKSGKLFPENRLFGENKDTPKQKLVFTAMLQKIQRKGKRQIKVHRG